MEKPLDDFQPVGLWLDFHLETWSIFKDQSKLGMTVILVNKYGAHTTCHALVWKWGIMQTWPLTLESHGEKLAGNVPLPRHRMTNSSGATVAFENYKTTTWKKGPPENQLLSCLFFLKVHAQGNSPGDFYVVLSGRLVDHFSCFSFLRRSLSFFQS